MASILTYNDFEEKNFVTENEKPFVVIIDYEK
jgi:hypothetical protein